MMCGTHRIDFFFFLLRATKLRTVKIYTRTISGVQDEWPTTEVGLDFVRDDPIVPESLGLSRGCPFGTSVMLLLSSPTTSVIEMFPPVSANIAESPNIWIG